MLWPKRAAHRGKIMATRVPVAVALRYDPKTDTAPRVVAKGKGAVAERIKQEAMGHDIKIVAQPSVVQALFRLMLNEEIPKELYLAVARVLAYIYEQRGLLGDRGE